jgi:hypothetical protein
MSNGGQSAIIAVGRTGVPFKGHQLGTHSAAIHAALRFSTTPMTLEAIIKATASVAKRRRIKDVAQRVKGHLRYWASRDVYIKTAAGWKISPAAQFDPEWQQGIDESQARNWYMTQCQAN